MEELLVKEVEGRLLEDGSAELNLEQVCIGLGFTQRQTKKGKVYESVRWETVRSYLKEFGCISTSGDAFPQQDGEKDLPKFIPESIFYKLCFKAKNKIAMRFQEWVTEEILPTIRKTGGYLIPKVETNEELLARAILVAQESLRASEARNKSLAAEAKIQRLRADTNEGKATVLRCISESKGSVTVGQFAKVLQQNGVKRAGQNRIYQWLRDRKYLLTKGSFYNNPAQYWVEEGWFELVRGNTNLGEVVMVTRLTAKGLANLVEIYLDECSDRPRKRRRRR